MQPKRRTEDRSRSRSGRRSAAQPAVDLRGASLHVLDGIPAVGLDSESPLFEHASWMLQTALDASGKADSLYEYVEDNDLANSCARELGMSTDDLGLVRVKQADLRDVMAIGTNGKRSIMLAVVVALLLKTKTMKLLWKELRSSGLGEMFLALVQSGKRRKLARSKGEANRSSNEWRGDDRQGRGGRGDADAEEDGANWGGPTWGWQDKSAGGLAGGGGATSSSWKEKDWGSSWKSGHDTRGNDEDDAFEVKSSSSLDGVELRYVMKNIPVVDLDATSVFHENISWLIQTAFDICGKADGVFEYYEDSRVLVECRRMLGMGSQETGTARCKKKELQHIMAVGTCGKRSTLLAILVAYAMHTEDHLEHMRDDVRKFDAKLGEAFDDLITLAAELSGVRLAWRSGGGRGQASRASEWEPWPTRSAWKDGDGDAYSRFSGGGSRYGSDGTSRMPPGGWPVPKGVDVNDLDSQLANYFQDDD